MNGIPSSRSAIWIILILLGLSLSSCQADPAPLKNTTDDVVTKSDTGSPAFDVQGAMSRLFESVSSCEISYQISDSKSADLHINLYACSKSNTFLILMVDSVEQVQEVFLYDRGYWGNKRPEDPTQLFDLFKQIGDINQDGREDFTFENHGSFKGPWSEVWVSVEGGWSRMVSDSGADVYVSELADLSTQGYFLSVMVPSSTSTVTYLTEVIPGTNLTIEKHSLFREFRSPDSIYHELSRGNDEGPDSSWWATTYEDFESLGLLPSSETEIDSLK